MASFNIEKRFTLQTVLATVCNCRGLIVLKLARYISPCLGKTSTGLLSLYVCVHNSATCDQCQFQLYYQTISAHQPLKLDDDAETEVLAASESTTRSTWSTWSTWTQYGTLSCALEFQLLCQLAGLKRACRTLVVENAALNCCPSCRVHSHVIIAYSTLKHHLATGPTTTAHADPAQSELALSSLGGYNSRKHFSNIARQLAYKHQETLTSNRP